MGHLANLGALTDELVTLLTATSSTNNPGRFNVHRESALRALRHSNHLRTNQFDVHSQLDGLEEKLRVYNEELLADALKERVGTVLSKGLRWTPEILHLLLELSNNPLRNSKLEDLDFLIDPEPDTGPPLRWKDLVAEDPLLRDKNIWKNIDYGAESSEDDSFKDSLSETSGTPETDHSSVVEDTSKQPEDYALRVTEKDSLEKLKEARFWHKTPKVDGIKLETVKKSVTELQALREVLFMLGGYPTSLFDTKSDAPDSIIPSKEYALKHASADAFYKVLGEFARRGSALISLRSWATRPQSFSLLQVFSGAILARIAQFDEHLSEIHKRFIEPEEDIVVSLLGIQAETVYLMTPLIRLSELVKRLDSEPYAHAFRYLELLYNETCTSQMAGDEQMYEFMGNIFFECFRIYLRPIRVWMEEGELSQDDKVFFISELSGQVAPAALWESRFKLRQTQDGILHAPRFLKATATKIFTTGKSVVILKYLNRFPERQGYNAKWEPLLDFNAVCSPQALRLAPFQELFDVAFDAWIQSKHQYASSRLQNLLFDSCGLHNALEAFAHIYFMTNGSASGAFTKPVFDKLDTLDSSWNDRFTLTEIAGSAFGVLPSVKADRIRIKVLPLSRKNQDSARCRRTVKALSIIELRYHISWPIQIIITPSTITSYQRVFTFLFQIRRSSQVITRQRLGADIFANSTSSNGHALYYSLRTRLLWFTQTLYYYITCLVLEPGTQRMRQSLKEAVDVDSMIEAHSSFLKSVMEQVLLGNKLDLIHKTILKVLDLAIKLEDAQSANAMANRNAMEQHQQMTERSLGSLGLQTPRKAKVAGNVVSPRAEDSSDDSANDAGVELSLLSVEDSQEEVSYVEQLRSMRAEFDRSVKFVTSGLKGVARAGEGDEARSWDILAEMLDAGLGNVSMGGFR